MNVHISTGNTKVGAIPSVSLPPVTTCIPNAPCIGKCYARNIIRRFKVVRQQWEENLAIYEADETDYFHQIYRFLTDNKPSYFRWHIGGDCPDWDYMVQVTMIGRLFPDTRFLMFTKRYQWASEVTIPENLTVLLSMWPYLDDPKEIDLPRVWVRGDLRAPADALTCSGQCTECLQCWNAQQPTTNILLKGH